jgi:hypothetical protein
MEIWKDVIGFEGRYEVSSLGNVKSKKTNKIIYTRKDKGGYVTCLFFCNMKIFSKKVHRLVAQAFIPNPLNKQEVNHKDRNRANNNLDNLEWSTPKENMNHAVINSSFKTSNTAIKKRLANKYACKKVIASENGNEIIFHSINEVVDYYNFSRTVVYKCLSGKQSSTRGIYFRYY